MQVVGLTAPSPSFGEKSPARESRFATPLVMMEHFYDPEHINRYFQYPALGHYYYCYFHY